MTLTCPRCSTSLSEDALYCSYCNLPKPKAGFGALAAEGQRQKQKQQPARPSKSPAAAKTDRRPRRRQSQGRELSFAKLAGVALIACSPSGAMFISLRLPVRMWLNQKPCLRRSTHSSECRRTKKAYL